METEIIQQSFRREELYLIKELLGDYVDRALDEYPEDFDNDEDVNSDDRFDAYPQIDNCIEARDKINLMLRIPSG